MNENHQVHEHLKGKFLFTYNAAKAAMRAYAASGQPGDPLLFHDALEASQAHCRARAEYVRFLEENPQTPLTDT